MDKSIVFMVLGALMVVGGLIASLCGVTAGLWSEISGGALLLLVIGKYK